MGIITKYLYPFLRFYLLVCCLPLFSFSDVVAQKKSPPYRMGGANVDFTKGYFILNEDFFGHHNSSINFFKEDKTFLYRVFRMQNNGQTIGCTAQWGQIYGQYIFFVSKQFRQGTEIGGRFVLCNSEDLTIRQSLPYIATVKNPDGSDKKDVYGNPIARVDGRGGVGVDVDKIYVSTSGGVYVYTPSQRVMSTNPIQGTENPFQKENEGVTFANSYRGQTGSMVLVGDRVFVAHQESGLLVIDTRTDLLMHRIEMPKDREEGAGKSPEEFQRGIGSVVLARNGKLYLSLTQSTKSTSSSIPRLLEVDPVTFETKDFPLPDGCHAPDCSWYSWTPDGFFASLQENALYWSSSERSDPYKKVYVYKYDLSDNSCQRLIDLSDGQWHMYGCSLRQNPRTGDLCMSQQFGAASSNVFRLVEYTSDGKLLGVYPMQKYHWYPSIPIFPDLEKPILQPLPIISVKEEEATPMQIALLDYISDADNMSGAIRTSIVSNSDPGIAQVKLDMNILYIIPTGNKGSTDIRIQYNSNGQLAHSTLTYKVGNNGIVPSQSSIQHLNAVPGGLYAKGLNGYHLFVYGMDGRMYDHCMVNDEQESLSLSLPEGYAIVYAVRGEHSVTFKLFLQEEPNNKKR